MLHENVVQFFVLLFFFFILILIFDSMKKKKKTYVQYMQIYARMLNKSEIPCLFQIIFDYVPVAQPILFAQRHL